MSPSIRANGRLPMSALNRRGVASAPLAVSSFHFWSLFLVAMNSSQCAKNVNVGTTGFNIGGIISPLIFGAIMDHGSPKLVFLLVAALSLIAIVTVATLPRRAE